MGIDPEYVDLNLTTGADFTCTGELDQDFPAGSTLSLVFTTESPTSWAATITGPEAVWQVDKAAADTVPDGTGVRLVYVNGSTDQVWAAGKVRRHG